MNLLNTDSMIFFFKRTPYLMINLFGLTTSCQAAKQEMIGRNIKYIAQKMINGNHPLKCCAANFASDHIDGGVGGY